MNFLASPICMLAVLCSKRVIQRSLSKRKPRLVNTPLRKTRLITKHVKPLRRQYSSTARDYYVILGISPTASAAEVKKAFFEKAKLYHPDVNKGDKDAQSKFVEITTAYETLKDTAKRATYDSQRQFSSFSDQGPRQQTHNRYQNHHQHYHHNPNNHFKHQSWQNAKSHEEFMKWYQSAFGDAFRDMEGQFRHAQHQQQAQRNWAHSTGRRVNWRDIFGTGGHRTESYVKHYPIRGTEVTVPSAVNISEAEMYSNKKESVLFQVTSSVGHMLGEIREKPQSKGEIFLFVAPNGSVVAKARKLVKDHKEKIIIENHLSHRLASLEEISPSDEGAPLPIRLVQQVVERRYSVLDHNSKAVGHVIIPISEKDLVFYNEEQDKLAQIRLETNLYEGRDVTLDSWRIKIDGELVDPSAYLFLSVFVTQSRRKYGNGLFGKLTKATDGFWHKLGL